MQAAGICLWHGWVFLEHQLELERGLGSLQQCQLVHLLISEVVKACPLTDTFIYVD